MTNQGEFRSARLLAKTCVYTDSGRLPTDLTRLDFDDAQIVTRKFAEALRDLLSWAGDKSCYYVVLDPDPDYYFYRLYNAYPAVEFEVTDLPEHYISRLAEYPDQQPADAVGTNWMECVIVPPSMTWFVHALRSELDNGGHIWIPDRWVTRLISKHPFTRVHDR